MSTSTRSTTHPHALSHPSAGAAGRAGGLGVWPVVFALCALVPTIFAVMTVRGLATAAAAYGTVRGGAR